MRDRRRPRRDRGASALEFVLIAPILILFMAGALTFSLAAAAKFRMSDAAMIAARKCVMGTLGQCATTVPEEVRRRWPDGARQCARGGMQASVSLANSVATVEVRCAFSGGVFQGVLGFATLDLTTSAAMPY